MKNYFSKITLILLLCAGFLTFNSCRNDDDSPDESENGFTGVNTNAKNLTTRFIYIVPSDRELKNNYTTAVKAGATNLTAWYKTQLNNGKTFHLNDLVVETIQSTHPASWFNANNGASSGTDPQYYFYSNAKNDLIALLGSSYDTSKYTYVVYVDAVGATGAGAVGLCIMPEHDLLGLSGQATEPVSRWIGGAGHELGHAFGLAHPDNQDPNAIMWTGYTLYPNCYFTDADKATLNSNAFVY